jgi:transcription elongation factor Elf1
MGEKLVSEFCANCGAIVALAVKLRDRRNNASCSDCEPYARIMLDENAKADTYATALEQCVERAEAARMKLDTLKARRQLDTARAVQRN